MKIYIALVLTIISMLSVMTSFLIIMTILNPNPSKFEFAFYILFFIELFIAAIGGTLFNYLYYKENSYL